MNLSNYEAITLLTALKALIREIGGDADKIFGTNIDAVEQNKAVDELANLMQKEGDVLAYLQSLYQKIVAEFRTNNEESE